MEEDEKQSERHKQRRYNISVRGSARDARTAADFSHKQTDDASVLLPKTRRRGAASIVFDELAFDRAFLFAPFIIALGAIWWFFRPISPVWWGLWLYWLFAFSSALALRHTGPVKRICAGAIALFLSGALFAQLETGRLATVMLDSAVTTHVTGVVDAREQTKSGWRYVARVIETAEPEIHRPPERVTIVARGKMPPIEIGGEFKGLARLSPPSGPALPGLVDFGFLSYFDGIGAVGFFYGAPEPLANPIDEPQYGMWNSAGLLTRHGVERLRDAIAARIRAVLPGESGAFANAIITGQRRAMDDETLDALRNAGLAHVIAISGLHMALAAGLFFSTLRLLLSFSPKTAEAIATKKLAAVTAIAAAAFYLAISGMQVSAQRAFIMLAIMLFAAIVDRPAISMRNVALAGLVILLISPSEVAGPGMQMSFAATLALIAGYNAWQRRGGAHFDNKASHRWLRFALLGVFGILMTALIGGISTAPIAMAHFQRIAGYGLLGNLLAMPIVTFLVMPAGLMAVIAMPLNLHAPFLLAMGWGLDWVIMIAKWVNSLGGALDTGAMPTGFLLLFFLGFIPLVLLKTRLRIAGVLPMAIAFALPALSSGERPQLMLVSESGKLVALVKENTAALSKSRPPSFIFDQWQSALSLSETVPPVESKERSAIFDGTDRFDRLDAIKIGTSSDALAKDIRAARAMPGTFLCETKEWCVAASKGGGVVVAQIYRPALTGAACDNADIVVSVYRPGFQKCRSGSFLITPALRRQTGTLQFTLTTASRHEMASERTNDATKPHSSNCIETKVSIQPSIVTIDRLWNKHRLYSWRSGEYSAPTDLPKSLTLVSDSVESGRQACLEP